MFILGRCKKCGEITVFDIGNFKEEEAKQLLSETPINECPGGHVEIGSWVDYYHFDWFNLYETQKEAIHSKELTMKLAKEA